MTTKPEQIGLTEEERSRYHPSTSYHPHVWPDTSREETMRGVINRLDAQCRALAERAEKAERMEAWAGEQARHLGAMKMEIEQVLRAWPSNAPRQEPCPGCGWVGKWKPTASDAMFYHYPNGVTGVAEPCPGKPVPAPVSGGLAPKLRPAPSQQETDKQTAIKLANDRTRGSSNPQPDIEAAVKLARTFAGEPSFGPYGEKGVMARALLYLRDRVKELEAEKSAIRKGMGVAKP